MRTQTFISSMAGIAAAAVVAGSANATFVEFYTVKTQPTADASGINLDVYVLYARFNGATDTVLTASNFNRTDASQTNMFFHKDNSSGNTGVLQTAFGTWNPALTGSATLNRPFDSYVTIGGLPTALNGTGFDPNWGNPATWNRPDVPNGQNAGWYAPSGSIAGRVGQSGNLADSTRLGQFSIARDSYAGVWNMRIGYNNGVAGSAVQFAESTFSIGVAVPAPGAIALLGLAGLTGRRRR
jgi:MYXO-CTERM domain-containing protein